jgi:adenylate cyclase
MHRTAVSPATILVRATAAINASGNLSAILITFFYFAILESRLQPGGPEFGLADRALFMLVVTALVVGVIAPINTTWVIMLARRVGRGLQTPGSTGASPQPEALRSLAGRLLNLPVRLAVTNLAGWCLGAVVMSALPHILPQAFPWPHDSSHKISTWMVIVGAPITASWIYFSQERWLRLRMKELFPPGALTAVPPSARINVLPKMLVVSLLMTIVPLGTVAHVSLHQITEIQAGRQSLENFLTYGPNVIWFLAAVFAVLAAGLSIFMAKSVSEPLQDLESAMDAVGEGNLDVAVPVVSNDEIGRMGEGFNHMVAAQKELDSIRDTFGRYLSKEVVDEILKSPGGVELRGEVREMTVLVSDLRGFTAITAMLDPERVLKLINRYLERMTEIIMRHGGTIDEFTGDGILVFFGAPQAIRDHDVKAVHCALEMQAAMPDLNASNRLAELPELTMGIGINCGELVVGNIGSEKRKKYGAVGSAINIAFRVEEHTTAGEILVSPAMFERLSGRLDVGGSREGHLKGIEGLVPLYRVVGLRPLAGREGRPTGLNGMDESQGMSRS